jgi:hypothetical protein
VRLPEAIIEQPCQSIEPLTRIREWRLRVAIGLNFRLGEAWALHIGHRVRFCNDLMDSR